MKTLKLSGLALLFMSIFSCTKSDNTLDQTQQVSKTVNTPNTFKAVDPGLTITFNPNPGVVGQPVTVTGTFDGTTAIPDCGMFHLFQKINGAWVKVADGNISASAHSVTYQFTPATSGDKAYEFYLQYIAGNCSGFSETASSSFFLDVVDACKGFNLNGTVANAVDQGNGTWLFTVKYTLNACGIEYNHLKTQGGLTAFSNQVQNLTEGATSWEVGNSSHPNTIIKWEESEKLANNTKTYSITFQKPWSGSGSVQLTGQWSTHADLNGADAGTATFDPIYYHN